MGATARKLARIPLLVLVAVKLLLRLAPPLFAQTIVGTGGIVGTVSDPSGAELFGAKVTITNVATGQVINLATNSYGACNCGAIERVRGLDVSLAARRGQLRLSRHDA
jgi:hypothetical protein